MAVDEVSCRELVIGQEFRNLGRCSRILMRAKNNFRIILVTAYSPTIRNSTGGTYSQQVQSLTIMKIKNELRNPFWIDLNTNTTKWMYQGEQIIIMGYWDSES